MQKYFLYTTKQEGPFTIDELKIKGVKRDSPIWFEGLSEWTSAGNIDELKVLFTSSPPHFIPEQVTETSYVFPAPPKKKKRVLPWVLLILLVIVTASAIIIPKIQRENDKASFRNYPNFYISAHHNGFKYNPVFGGITDLKITIDNSSKFNVNNVRIIISYIRKNGNTYKEEFVDSGFIPAYGNAVVSAPDSDAGMDVKVKVFKVNSSEAGLY
jgi:hypothetical protein